MKEITSLMQKDFETHQYFYVFWGCTATLFILNVLFWGSIAGYAFLYGLMAVSALINRWQLQRSRKNVFDSLVLMDEVRDVFKEMTQQHKKR